MAAALSVIIPTLNAAGALPACLAALYEGVPAGLIREVIVTDGGSTDDTLQIADGVGAVVMTGPASRGGQLQRGAQAATGSWLLVIHADTVLQAGWAAQVAAHIEASSAPAYFPLAFDQRGVMARWVAGWANLRSRVFALPYGDQGLLMPGVAYRRAGGYPDQPLMEDVHLVRKLGRPLVQLEARAVTSAARYRRAGWLRRGARNLWTLTRYFAGADPQRLADRYRR